MKQETECIPVSQVSSLGPSELQEVSLKQILEFFTVKYVHFSLPPTFDISQQNTIYNHYQNLHMRKRNDKR